jgi:uncharacterized membrane protein
MDQWAALVKASNLVWCGKVVDYYLKREIFFG